jgi:nitrite reductase (NADH) small subunit
MPLTFDSRAYNVVGVDGQEFHVRPIGGQFHVIRSRCPHRGGPLRLGRIDGEVLVCPWHSTRVALSKCVGTAAPAVFRRSSSAIFVAIDGSGREPARLRWAAGP